MFVRGRPRSGRDERARQRRSAGSFRAWFVVLSFVVPDRVFVVSVLRRWANSREKHAPRRTCCAFIHQPRRGFLTTENGEMKNRPGEYAMYPSFSRSLFPSLLALHGSLSRGYERMFLCKQVDEIQFAYELAVSIMMVHSRVSFSVCVATVSRSNFLSLSPVAI
ncbi:unnamed protein product [Heterotrigona itama]|uniref:Uncharacterized protein n=1 Tax=Heterotrigona itama TaxID=395501 RepID=A0A6V7GZD0_9HYME|nr:unnamed protein product [Heterotrigona itama]